MQQVKKDNQKAFLLKKVATKHGVTMRYARMVITGERSNDGILEDYMSMKEITDCIEHIQDNPLMEAVLAAVPF
jgi:hypothetical protein